jgi:hypothetical protein
MKAIMNTMGEFVGLLTGGPDSSRKIIVPSESGLVECGAIVENRAAFQKDPCS